MKIYLEVDSEKQLSQLTKLVLRKITIITG